MSMPRDDLPYCQCNWFERAAHDPDCAVEFDPELNEYNLKTANGGSMRMYHCPFCAGRAPESLRGQMFATVTSEETFRLHQLTKDLKTEADVREALGDPTHEFEPGVVSQSPPKEGEPPIIKSSKSLSYDQHSDSATIDVTVGRHGKVSITFSGKYIGKPTGR
ncbi:MAG: hypothetical protein KDN22_27925 [Verrucomicrobiae bacterium]|nr:hypothetical protein [Verrucomicrobiae bacterium]